MTLQEFRQRLLAELDRALGLPFVSADTKTDITAARQVIATDDEVVQKMLDVRNQ